MDQENISEKIEREISEEPNILILEDVPTDAELVKRELEKANMSFSSKCVETRADFLKALNDFAPDLIISDYTLPQFDGMSALRLAKEHAPEVPVIMATVPINEETAVECMKAGAADYVIKDRLARIAPAVKAVLENARSRREKKQLEENLLTVQHEFRIAREIQQGLFPKAVPASDVFDIWGASYPATAVGGDYYDYITMPEEHLGLVVGDVSGHGLGPALLMVETRAYLRALSQTTQGISEMLTLLNRTLSRDMDTGSFVTLIFVLLDPRTRTLSYTSAGHNTCYVLNSSGTVKKELKSVGPPLGIFPEIDFSSVSGIHLEPGDIVCLLTDGVIEAFTSDNTTFDINRVLENIRANCEKNAQEMVTALYNEVHDFYKGEMQNDDITVVVLKVT
ncbi:MAG: SpoIIE family protein phosphatase [Planctomycetota bacterium]|jgi:serine phosphatase RsbU (regulator of sigma subunit)